ncbi:MAG: hypothetical protein WKG32_15610 [Gemmatimonadaceae bacterium]
MRFHAVPLLLVVGIVACSPKDTAAPPVARLGNPVLDARAALAAGDSTYLGLLDPELVLPGLDSAEARREGTATVRAFSRRSLALAPAAWLAQRDSLRVYAAAYNRLILEARRASGRA